MRLEVRWEDWPISDPVSGTLSHAGRERGFIADANLVAADAHKDRSKLDMSPIHA